MGEVAGLLIGLGLLVVLAAYIARSARMLPQGGEPDERRRTVRDAMRVGGAMTSR